MDDIDEIRRKRTIKVLLTDFFMATSVVAIVIILVAAVAGWRINSDFSVEQNGLVSIKTHPTDATVFIDEEKQYQHSSMSKMLPGGKHLVALEKDGYERWEKEINVTPGWLLRLEYPRLIKQNREKTTIKEFEKLKFFYVSPNRTTAIYSEENSTDWVIVTDLTGTPKFKHIDIKGIFNGTSDGKFNLEFRSIEWSKNTEKILLHVANDKIDEWGIINLKDIKESVNLSDDYSRFVANSENLVASARKTSSEKISQAKFENEAGDKIVAITSNNLMRIDTVSKTVSGPFAEDAVKFAIYDQTLIYQTKFEESNSYIKTLRLGEKVSTIVAVNTDEDAIIAFEITRFNSTNYLLYTIDNHLYVYKANDFPSGNDKFNMTPVADVTIGIVPSEASVSNNKEFITLREGSRVVVFDTELELYHEYDYGDEVVRFLDTNMMSRVDKASNKFLTWDFDGTNVRTLVVDNAAYGFDSLITTNNKYFYYIKTTETGFALIQETL